MVQWCFPDSNKLETVIIIIIIIIIIVVIIIISSINIIITLQFITTYF